jgi:hypothetical protein
VYASNFGTHQKTNLVTLCRKCHEKEHKRVFDFGENIVATDEHQLWIAGITIAAAYIESGVRNFTQYAELMIEEMGEEVKPYLLSFWEGIRSYPDLDTSDMTDEAESARQFLLFSRLDQHHP